MALPGWAASAGAAATAGAAAAAAPAGDVAPALPARPHLPALRRASLNLSVPERQRAVVLCAKPESVRMRRRCSAVQGGPGTAAQGGPGSSAVHGGTGTATTCTGPPGATCVRPRLHFGAAGLRPLPLSGIFQPSPDGGALRPVGCFLVQRRTWLHCIRQTAAQPINCACCIDVYIPCRYIVLPQTRINFSWCMYQPDPVCRFAHPHTAGTFCPALYMAALAGLSCSSNHLQLQPLTISLSIWWEDIDR